MIYRPARNCKIGTILALMILLAAAAPARIIAQHHAPGRSDSADQHGRTIKSLSPGDVEDLKAGRGWDLAKAAELNGVPGPVHLLELKSELGLNPAQIERIERQFTEMRRKAKRLGAEYIELERMLNVHFASGTIDEAVLRDLLDRIGKVRVELRFTHLETHLRTPAILTANQTARYSQLRGYTENSSN